MGYLWVSNVLITRGFGVRSRIGHGLWHFDGVKFMVRTLNLPQNHLMKENHRGFLGW